MQFDRLQYIYFITFDYYSAFFEVDKLETTDFRTVVEKLKMQFNLHGIPEISYPTTVLSMIPVSFRSLQSFQHITHKAMEMWRVQ